MILDTVDEANLGDSTLYVLLEGLKTNKYIVNYRQLIRSVTQYTNFNKNRGLLFKHEQHRCYARFLFRQNYSIKIKRRIF